VQKESGVLPVIASIGDGFKTAADLKNLPGIGSATLETHAFPDYATSRGEAFVPQDQREASDVLSNFEPSAPLRDDLGSVYFFRLTDMSPEHQPATLDEVAAAVRADYITAAAYEQAKTAAEELVKAAAQSGIIPASSAAKRGALTTGFFPLNPDAEIPNYRLEQGPRARFIVRAFDLLTTPTTQPSGKRIELIDLPQFGRVIVAELDDVRSVADPANPQMANSIVQQLAQEFDRTFQVQWYNYDEVVSRLKYQPVGEKS
jgi:hypothetical protein